MSWHCHDVVSTVIKMPEPIINCFLCLHIIQHYPQSYPHTGGQGVKLLKYLRKGVTYFFWKILFHPWSNFKLVRFNIDWADGLFYQVMDSFDHIKWKTPFPSPYISNTDRAWYKSLHKSKPGGSLKPSVLVQCCSVVWWPPSVVWSRLGDVSQWATPERDGRDTAELAWLHRHGAQGEAVYHCIVYL